MTSTRLYIVRHGETEYNRRGIVQGRKIDSVLNATGVSQAHALGRYLGDVAFDAVYASQLRRALQTAHIVTSYQPCRHDVRAEPDLAEMSWGVYEGRPLSDPEVHQGIDALKVAWNDGHYDEPVEGGESVHAVRDRGVRAMNRLIEHHAGECVLIVTHGRFIRILLASLLAAYGLDRMEEIEHDNTGINILRHGPDGFAADVLNDLPHLESVG